MQSKLPHLKCALLVAAFGFSALQASAQSFIASGGNIVSSGFTPATSKVGIGTTAPASILSTDGETNTAQGQWRGRFFRNGAEGVSALWIRGRGTIAAPAALQNGDYIGSFNGYGYTDGSSANLITPAFFGFVVDGAVAVGNLPTKFSVVTGNGSSLVSMATPLPNATPARRVQMEISSAGKVKFADLIGTGSRMVVTDAAGQLGTAAIPGGVGSILWSLSGSTAVTANGATSVRVTGLAGVGTRMVVADASGILGVQTNPWVTSGTSIYSYNTGTVGIGTVGVTPYKLTVQTATNNFGLVHTDGTIQVGTFAGTKTYPMGGFGTKTSHPLGLFTKDQTPALLVDTMSRVGVGTLTPSAVLHAYGTDSVYYSPPQYNGQFFLPGYTLGGVAKVGSPDGTLLFDGDEIQSAGGGFQVIGSTYGNLFLQRRYGNLAIGNTYSAGSKLTVQSDYDTYDTNIATFTSANHTAGVGIGYGTIRATGTNGNNNLNLQPQLGGSVVVSTNSTLATNVQLALNEEDSDFARLQFTNTNSGYWHVAGFLDANNYYADNFRFYHNAAGDIMTIQGGPSVGTGRVGIGTTAPGYALDVCGTIRGKEVRVETGWCDYVFEPTFKLRPIAEVKSFIAANKHLPDVTPAADIEANGLQVGAVMKQHMLKIEELTLYTIEQDEQLKVANAKIAAQNATIEQIMQRLNALEAAHNASQTTSLSNNPK